MKKKSLLFGLLLSSVQLMWCPPKKSMAYMTTAELKQCPGYVDLDSIVVIRAEKAHDPPKIFRKIGKELFPLTDLEKKYFSDQNAATIAAGKSNPNYRHPWDPDYESKMRLNRIS